MDAIDLLIKEHANHRELLDTIESDKSLYQKLRDEIIHHVNMEEAVFYPALLKVKTLEPIVREAWEEHNLIMQLLQEMDELSLDDKQWESKFSVLKKLLLTHLDDEEEKLFKRVKSMATPEYLHDVGEQMRIQKKLTNPDEILYPDEVGSHKLQN